MNTKPPIATLTPASCAEWRGPGCWPRPVWLASKPPARMALRRCSTRWRNCACPPTWRRPWPPGPRPPAADFFAHLSRTDRRNLLQWLVLARRPDTRQRRLTASADLAARQQRPTQFDPRRRPAPGPRDGYPARRAGRASTYPGGQ